MRNLRLVAEALCMNPPMRCALVILLPLTMKCSAEAQQYASPLTQCVQGYYDPSNYNWLTYRNTCNEAIHVTMVSGDGSNVGAIDLGPGRHDGPGLTAKEVRAIGGMEAYACPAHYAAVDADGEPLRSQISAYRCKKNY